MIRQMIFSVTVVTVLLSAACSKGTAAPANVTSSTAVNVPTSSTAANVPTSSTAANVPTSSTAVNVPTTSTAVNVPTTSSVVATIPRSASQPVELNSAICIAMAAFGPDSADPKLVAYVKDIGSYVGDRLWVAEMADVAANCPRYSKTFVSLDGGRTIANRSAAAAADASKASASAVAQASSSEALAESSAVNTLHERAKVTYTITGSANSALITYMTEGSSIEQANNASVPWTKDLTIAAGDYRFLSVSAQNSGGGSITCSILVAGVVVNTNTSTGDYAIAVCNYSG